MVHQRKRLALRFKARNHALGIHSWLNHLQRHAPMDWFFLFRHENNAATAFADLVQQFVPIHPVARLFTTRGFSPPLAYHFRWLFQESSGPINGLEPSLYFVT